MFTGASPRTPPAAIAAGGSGYDDSRIMEDKNMMIVIKFSRFCRRCLPAAVVFFLSVSGSPADDGLPPGLEKEVLERNPRIAAARRLTEAAAAGVSAAGWPDDPVFTYGYFGESIQTRVGPQKNLFQLSQKLPLAKLSLRGDIAEKEAAAAAFTADETVWEVLTDFKAGYFDLWWLKESLRLIGRQIEVIEDLEEIARSRYSAGSGDQGDVYQAGLRLARLRERELILQRRRRSLFSRLNRLRDRPAERPLAVSIVEPVMIAISRQACGRLARQYRPALRAEDLKREGRRLGAELARRASVPDLTVGARYYQIGSGETAGPDDGRDAWLLTAGIDLPVWFWRDRALIRRADAISAAAEESYRRVLNRIDYEIDEYYFRLEDARRRLDLYREEILPRAESTVETDRAAYEAGRTDFLDLLNSEEKLLEAELDYRKTVAEQRRARAGLERAVGRRLAPPNPSENQTEKRLEDESRQ